ncbi:MAG: amylo-alpha-1,6-glucosidase [Bacteroidales bacterium]|nr:amylo-alpha-1,6-glucosidase [Bacteroidales bacterium]
MAFLKFDKAELVNLEYSTSREVLRSNRAGSYASTTISGCNTRKYHGLLICPLDEMGGEHHVLLSSLDLTVIQHEKKFNLGIHKYEGDNYVPRGHKYIRDYDAEAGSKMTYRVGGVVLTRETMLVQEKEQILIKITLEEANSSTKLRLQPFLAFRNIHKLSKANLYLNRQYIPVNNGIKSRMYDGYPDLYMQVSKKAEFVPVPDWYYNIEYLEEQRRGYGYKEDLYVPGYFELAIKKGESVIFSASTGEEKPAGMIRKFQSEEELRTPLDSFRNCLLNSAQQFILRRGDNTDIIAGFPWYGVRGRDTFIALPGITLTLGDVKTATEVINTMIRRLKDGLFPHTVRKGHQFCNAIDAPLWFVWTLQQLEQYIDIDIWKHYRKQLLEIMDNYIKGTSCGISMDDNGLITGGEEGIPVTWMDASAKGHAVTLRKGYAVEVNALWYNAVQQVLSWAGKGSAFYKKWKDLPEKIEVSFVKEFWLQDLGYLADYVNNGYKDISVRPNQVIATSLNFSPVSKEMKKNILDVVKSELLTPKGLRTLSPKNVNYRGSYKGNQEQRDRSLHQGIVHPWLLEHFVRGYLDLYKRSGLNMIEQIYAGFEADMTEYGIGTISELYDGNPPHDPSGAISFAGSVASLLRIGEMIDKFN